ncbi:MAG TPA: hypothetical protein PK667_01925, partial [Nitrosomonas europaea]|uniref:hypothetical protein n=1 Tax=Nitrosomonas europaea TaxID=915 RepID=UPI002D1C0BE1
MSEFKLTNPPVHICLTENYESADKKASYNPEANLTSKDCNLLFDVSSILNNYILKTYSSLLSSSSSLLSLEEA